MIDLETGSEPDERLDFNHFGASLNILFVKFVDEALNTATLFKM